MVLDLIVLVRLVTSGWNGLKYNNIWSRFIKFSTCNKQNTKHSNTMSWSNSKSKQYYNLCRKMYSPNFSAENKIFCLSLHYNGDDSYLSVNGKKVTKFKAKKSEIKANQLTLGSISTSANLSSSDTEDSKLYGNVYDFSVDYSTISNDKILDINSYLIKKIWYNINVWIY